MSASALPNSVDAMLDLLTSHGYLADRSLATVTYLSLRMGRPLFLEGEAGVGKTEIAKVLRQHLAASCSGCSATKGSMSRLPSMSGILRRR